MNVRTGKRTGRQVGLLRALFVAVLCLVTNSCFDTALALGDNSVSLTGDEHFTLNGYKDIFKSNGSGTLIATAESGKELGLCPLRHTDVTANISGYVARVTVKQIFENSYDQKIEAIYTFPLSDTSAVDDMVMQIGDRTIHGTIKKREDAAQIYAEAKVRGQAAALLEQERSNIFTQSVANILPGERIVVTLQYTDLLPFENGRFTFAFPTVVGPRFIPGSSGDDVGASPMHIKGTLRVPDADRIKPPVAQHSRSGHDISIRVYIDAGVPIDDISSQMHEVIVSPIAEERASISLKDKAAIPNRDFVLSWNVAQDKLASSYLAHRHGNDKEGTGYFTLMLLPPKRITKDELAPKEMIFVVDRSGSQAGAPLEKAKETLKYVVQHMNPRDTFQIMSFSNSTELLFDKPQPANPLTKLKAENYIDALRADGGTLMEEAVEKVCKMPTDRHRLRIVTLMTDGYIGNDQEVINFVRKFRASSRWFPFGTGNSVNRTLIDGVAKAGGGEPDYVYLNASGDEVGKKFYDKIASPLLTDVRLRFNGLSVSEVFPTQPSDVWAKRPLYFQGRYSKGGTGTVTLSGFAGGKPYSKTMPVILPNLEPENAVIEPIWARAKVDQLMEEKDVNTRRHSTQEALVREITNVALAHHIMTQYTSFVAVDESTHRLIGDSRTVAVPVELPEGSFGSSWFVGRGLVGAPVAPRYSQAGGCGLVGAPVAPRYGQSNEVGMIADYGYDTARDLLRLMTIIAALVCAALTIRKYLKGRAKKVTGKDLVQVTVVVIGIPLAIHVVGIFMINNFGGLGGGF